MVEQTGEHALEHSPALCQERSTDGCQSFCAAWLKLQSQLLLSAWPQENLSLWESLWPLLQPPVNKQGDKSGEVEYVSDMRLKVQKDLVESLGGCPGSLWGKGTLQSPEAALRPWVTLPPASLLVCSV